MIQNFIFDLDGTIIDSADEIIDCLQKSYRDAGFERVHIQRSNIGPPLEKIISDLTPEITAIQRSLVLKAFRKYYDGSFFRQTYVKEGVRGTLEVLDSRGLKTFIVTNKPIKPTLSILKVLRLNGFRDVMSPDKYGTAMGKKELLSFLIDTWKLDCQKTIYIGDSAADVDAAKESGVRSAALMDGYGEQGRVIESEPDFLLGSFRDILKILLVV